jgi:MoaA/NifB/PqqE/SkfB family radical SAM enzyme
VSKDAAKRYVDRFHLPKLVLLENTVSCNLNCLVCDRKEAGRREQKTMSLADMEIAAARIKEAGVEDIWFFGHGEPFLSTEINQELSILRRVNPAAVITSSTNGLKLDSDEKREAALLLDRIWFSIDGSTDDSVRKYQRGGSFTRAYANMIRLVEYRNAMGKTRPIIEWKYVVFKWNDTEDLVSRAIRLAREGGVDFLTFHKAPWPDYGITNLFESAGHFISIRMLPYRGGGVYRELDLKRDIGPR